jgi:putative DNA primase/helicase
MRKLPVKYKTDAMCPATVQFLDSTLEPEPMADVLRMIAYCLLPSSKYETAFMLVGEGSNGKSTLLKLVRKLLGEENCSAISLQDLASDKFAKEGLYGKMANLFADLQPDRIKNGDFKLLVSGDRVRAQKKFGQPFDFENTAVLIFSTNSIPPTDDDSYAYFRRWKIIPFNHTFEGAGKNTNLLEKITTSEELSGLLYWAIEMLRQLNSENGFQHSDIEEVRKQYQLGASKIHDFIKDCCVLSEGGWIRTADLNNALAVYCKSKGTNFVDIREFGKALAKLGIEHKQKRMKSEKPWCYFGIGLKEGVTVSQRTETLPNETIDKYDNNNK